KYLSLDVIAEHRESLQRFVGDNTVLAIAIYTLIYICTVAFSLPGGALLTILGGFLFGTLLGASATVIAATIGATAVFLIARSAIGDVLVRKAGPWIKKLSDGFNDDAFSYLMFLRLVPAFPFFVVNIAPALFNVRLSTYMITTFLGIIPGTIAFTFVGSGLDSIIVAQKTAHEACVAEKGAEQCPFGLDAGALINPQIIAGFVALGVVALIPVVIKRAKARKGKAN
ncbi:MAG: TVP38/TMEM64 family protein, partial [Rhizobiales bacterium]|nr:TVP38/TMEM64 family protein [Hyphomicrobiales bacterium]